MINMTSPETPPWENSQLAVNGREIRENFNSWFKDSAIRHEDGSPMVVYRGDKNTVDSFDPNQRREPGQFFCLEPDRAAFYGAPHAYVLQASNVLDLRDVYGQWRRGGKVTEIVNSLYADHYEGDENPESGEPYSVSDVITAIEEGFLWKMDGLGGWKMNAWRNLQEIVSSEGFDALMVYDDGEGIGKGLDVVVFGADQVKSLYGNSGLFLKGSLSVSDRQQALDIEKSLKASEVLAAIKAPETEMKEDFSVDGVLSLLSRLDSSYSSATAGGNCGMFAMALARVAGADRFVFVENEAEPERLYHVAIKKDGVYLDGSGVVSHEALMAWGFDDEKPDSEPKIIEVEASEALFLKYIQAGTDPDIGLDEWESAFRSAMQKHNRQKP